jgi:hypothetical protein
VHLKLKPPCFIRTGNHFDATAKATLYDFVRAHRPAMQLIKNDELRSVLNLQAFLEHPPHLTATRNGRSRETMHARSFPF